MQNLIFFDTEFMDDGKTIEMLSIGLVKQDNTTYYAEPEEANIFKANPWVKENVLPLMDGPKKPRLQIRDELVEWCGYDPIFWTYFGAYDWVALCQLFGTMLDVPNRTRNWPMFNMDIQQLRVLIHPGMPLPKHIGRQHHALDDAIWTKDCYNYLMKYVRTANDNERS